MKGPATVEEKVWGDMVAAASRARDSARVHGKTQVGAAALSEQGAIHAGCNVEHMFRSHDIHAEVNALSTMVAAGDGPVVAIVIVADRDRFTPCGSCLDWIFELGGGQTLVSFHLPDDPAPRHRFTAEELMPYYPN